MRPIFIRILSYSCNSLILFLFFPFSLTFTTKNIKKEKKNTNNLISYNILKHNKIVISFKLFLFLKFFYIYFLSVPEYFLLVINVKYFIFINQAVKPLKNYLVLKVFTDLIHRPKLTTILDPVRQKLE